MFGLKITISLCLILCLAICHGNQDSINKDIVNSKVQRTVDLTTHLPQTKTTITLENKGKSSIRMFLYAVEKELNEDLSFITAVSKSSDDEQKLSVSKSSVANEKDKAFYRIDLSEPLESGKTTVVEVHTYFSHSLTPYPSEIKQSEKQLVRYIGNVYFYSPYQTTTQTTTVELASSSVESYTKSPKPASLSDTTVTYGPYEDVASFSESPLDVHYENNRPFMAVTEMDRLIEVSHWGNIAVEETIDIRHTGALLKGSFSRYEYQRNQDGYSSVKSFTTLLPASARDVYYRDEIGNISTSNLRESDEHMEMEIRPRFPLFGGWKTHYIVGYNVPSYQYLYNKGDKYILKMRFVDHVFDDQVIDHMTVRVILPEYATNIKLVTPYEVDQDANEKHFTYLDTVGRPVVVARKSDLTDGHIQDFELHYTFNKVMMLQEPLLVVAAFFLLFFTAIVYVRFDFSLTKDEASESRMRVASLVEQLQGVQDRRSALYQSYDDAINKFKASKDSSKFTVSRKKVDGDHKGLSQQIASMQAKLKAEGSDATEKVGELQKLDQQVKEHINQLAVFAEKLVAGKMNKASYVETEKSVQAKKQELIDKMDSILGSF